MPITIEKLSPKKRAALRLDQWPIWQCEPSDFPWHYDQEESFPKGLDCQWQVHTAVRKHYLFR